MRTQQNIQKNKKISKHQLRALKKDQEVTDHCL